MSLRLQFVRDISSLESGIIRDVEAAFLQTRLHDTSIVRKLLHEIEQGEYLDAVRFVDRFGTVLYTSELSTGCKAALILALGEQLPVSLAECGLNARDSIVLHVRSGTAVLPWNGITFRSYGSGPIDVVVDGVKHSSVDALNEYIDSSEFARRYYGLS